MRIMAIIATFVMVSCSTNKGVYYRAVSGERKSHNDLIEVVQEGEARIKNGDRIEARESAVRKALSNALVKKVSTKVSISHLHILENVTRISSEGLVKKYEILDTDYSDEKVRVRVKAWISQDAIEGLARLLAYRFRISIIGNGGFPCQLAAKAIENYIIQASPVFEIVPDNADIGIHINECEIKQQSGLIGKGWTAGIAEINAVWLPSRIRLAGVTGVYEGDASIILNEGKINALKKAGNRAGREILEKMVKKLSEEIHCFKVGMVGGENKSFFMIKDRIIKALDKHAEVNVIRSDPEKKELLLECSTESSQIIKTISNAITGYAQISAIGFRNVTLSME